MIEVEDPTEELELFINAMTGDFNYSTIRIPGKVKSKNISVLGDAGSNSSFIDNWLVKESNLPRTLTKPVVTTIADGSPMVSKSMCKNLK